MSLRSLLVGRNSKGDERVIKVDDSSDALTGIDYAHHEIHNGSSFKICTTTASLVDDGKQEFAITVGSKEIHLLFDGACGGDAIVELFESPTGVVGTNAVTPVNMNRVSDKESLCSVIQAPVSITTDGTRLVGMVAPGGTGGNAGGGSTTGRHEFILKPSLVYLLRLQNIAGAAKPASLFAEFYEHSPKN